MVVDFALFIVVVVVVDTMLVGWNKNIMSIDRTMNQKSTLVPVGTVTNPKHRSGKFEFEFPAPSLRILCPFGFILMVRDNVRLRCDKATTCFWDSFPVLSDFCGCRKYVYGSMCAPPINQATLPSTEDWITPTTSIAATTRQLAPEED